MSLIIRRTFNPISKDFRSWDAFTFLSLLAYAVGVFYFQLSFFNYYFLSIIFGFQLYYWISNQDETLEFKNGLCTYRFLFFKKNFRVKSYQIVSISYDRNPHSRNREKLYTECIFIQNEKVRFKIIKTRWSEDYEKIKNHLEKNYPVNNSVNRPFVIFKFTPDLFLFFTISFLFTTILTIGVAIENKQNSQIQKFVYIQSVLSADSEVRKERGGSKYMNLKLEEYPSAQFKIYENGMRELKRNKLFTFPARDTIGLYLDTQDYYIKLKRYEDYPYFTSHIIDKNEINVCGLFYNNYHLIDPYEVVQGKSRQESIRFLLPLIFIIIWLLNIFSNKITYTKKRLS